MEWKEYLAVMLICIAIGMFILAQTESESNIVKQGVTLINNTLICYDYDDCISYLKNHYTNDEIKQMKIGCNKEKCIVVLP